jgi:hypothetical protein
MPSTDTVGRSESPAAKKQRLADELLRLESGGEPQPPGHGAHVGPDPWGIAPKGAEVDMPECGKPVERSRHRSPVTAPQGGH